jgi:hypothetical protein
MTGRDGGGGHSPPLGGSIEPGGQINEDEEIWIRG